jgi:hypothetical protein
MRVGWKNLVCVTYKPSTATAFQWSLLAIGVPGKPDFGLLGLESWQFSSVTRPQGHLSNAIPTPLNHENKELRDLTPGMPPDPALPPYVIPLDPRGVPRYPGNRLRFQQRVATLRLRSKSPLLKADRRMLTANFKDRERSARLGCPNVAHFIGRIKYEIGQ